VEFLMAVRPFLARGALGACVALAAPALPAAAADYKGPPIFQLCAPPPSAIGTQKVDENFLAWAGRGDRPWIVDVERYDPHHPPAAVVPKYVVPETAYLASPLCQFPGGVSARSWYDGKLFYIQGGVGAAPDTFMVIERK
jgi:hypothetical protein